MKKIALVLLSFIAVIAFAFVGFPYIRSRFFPPAELLNPFSTGSVPSSASSGTDTNQLVYAFLPYWLVSKAQLRSEMTHLAYFSVGLNGDGTLRTKDGTRPNLSYQRYISENVKQIIRSAQQREQQTILTITIFDNEVLRELLESEQSQLTAIGTLTTLVKESGFDGVNLDFEPTTNELKDLQLHFVEFLAQLNADWEKNLPNTEIHLSVYPSAIEKTNIWDIENIAPHVDRIVIMTYDFHRASSQVAGPVSPLLSTGEHAEEKNIIYYIKKYVAVTQPEKLLLGVPFYGYEWEVTDPEPRSNTYPRTGVTASFERVQKILRDPTLKNVQQFWEDSTLTPFVSYEENGKTKLISYENAQSLGFKLDLVNQLHLGGIAIWALGYEGNSDQLWDVIEEKL